MKTAISIPDPIFKAAERLLKQLRISRSALYTKAVDTFIQSHSNENIKAALDLVYSKESSQVDSILNKMQAATFDKEDW